MVDEKSKQEALALIIRIAQWNNISEHEVFCAMFYAEQGAEGGCPNNCSTCPISRGVENEINQKACIPDFMVEYIDSHPCLKLPTYIEGGKIGDPAEDKLFKQVDELTKNK